MTAMAHLTCVSPHPPGAGERPGLVRRGRDQQRHGAAWRPAGGPRAPWTPTGAASPTRPSWWSWCAVAATSASVSRRSPKHPSSASLDHDADVLVHRRGPVRVRGPRCSSARGLPLRPGGAGPRPGRRHTDPRASCRSRNLANIRRQERADRHRRAASVIERISAHDGDPVAMRAAGIALAPSSARSCWPGSAGPALLRSTGPRRPARSSPP